MNQYKNLIDEINIIYANGGKIKKITFHPKFYQDIRENSNCAILEQMLNLKNIECMLASTVKNYDIEISL